MAAILFTLRYGHRCTGPPGTPSCSITRCHRQVGAPDRPVSPLKSCSPLRAHPSLPSPGPKAFHPHASIGVPCYRGMVIRQPRGNARVRRQRLQERPGDAPLQADRESHQKIPRGARNRPLFPTPRKTSAVATTPPHAAIVSVRPCVVFVSISDPATTWQTVADRPRNRWSRLLRPEARVGNAACQAPRVRTAPPLASLSQRLRR